MTAVRSNTSAIGMSNQTGCRCDAGLVDEKITLVFVFIRMGLRRGTCVCFDSDLGHCMGRMLCRPR